MDTKKSFSSNYPLPEELILLEILPKLPTKSVIRFKSVSKAWLSLISQHSSLIAAKHTAGEQPGSIISGRYRTHEYTRLFFLGHNESNLVEIDTSYIYKKKPATLLLVGSCNGLVCVKLFYSDKTDDLVLWNPATREVNYLPTREDHSHKGWFAGYTLCFDAHSGDYKVVRLEHYLNSVGGKIFSNKSGRWRNLKSFTLMPHTVVFLDDGVGLTVDGKIYWIALAHTCIVLSFDVRKEEFLEYFEGPPSIFDDDDVSESVLVNWKGSLGFVFLFPEGGEIQVWLKNKDSNNSYSGWQQISTIQLSLAPVPFEQLSLKRVYRGQMILLYYVDNFSDGWIEIFYDLVTKEKNELELGCSEKLHWYDIFDHLFTLVSST